MCAVWISTTRGRPRSTAVHERHGYYIPTSSTTTPQDIRTFITRKRRIFTQQLEHVSFTVLSCFHKVHRTSGLNHKFTKHYRHTHCLHIERNTTGSFSNNTINNEITYSGTLLKRFFRLMSTFRFNTLSTGQDPGVRVQTRAHTPSRVQLH